MNISRKLTVLLVGLAVTGTIAAATPEETEQNAGMPMANQGMHMMMNPEVMQQMMSSGQLPQMPMMNHQAMHQMMHQMPHMGYGHGSGHMMPMMGHGMPMMNPQIMQMRMQHMAKMEKHLENIESLLTQILEAQTSR